LAKAKGDIFSGALFSEKPRVALDANMPNDAFRCL